VAAWATAPNFAGGRCQRITHRQIATNREVDQPALQGSPLEQDVPTTGAATQTNVSTQPVDEPLLAAAWVGATQLDDVAQAKRDDRRLVCGHY
jgi:hypothetical protein